MTVNTETHKALRALIRRRIVTRMTTRKTTLYVAKNLQWLIAKAKTNPNALAEATGLKQPTIHRMLTGESEDPRTSSLKPLADYFSVSISDLRERDLSKEEDLDRTPSEDEFALIPQLDVRAACGPGGKFHDHVVVKGGLAFKKSFIREMGLTENTARVINADGPSMEPTIGHGRVVMVNLADKEPQDSKVFLICDEDGGMVLKRLVREYEPSIGATVWKIRSDNPDKRKYPDKVWPEDSITCIVGRAVWHDGLL